MKNHNKTKLPDYQNSTINLTCSVLRYFGAEAPEHASLPGLERLLQTEYKNVVVLLLDGMGTSVLEQNLEPDGFFRAHLQESFSAVFPSTTVAATTSIDSGLTPAEHGWLGWSVYYRELDKNVDVFTNQCSETGEPAAPFHAAWKYCPYTSVSRRMMETDFSSYQISQFSDDPVFTYSELCDRVRTLCARQQRKYIYAYWNEPDHTMHETGVDSFATKCLLEELEEQTEALSRELSDTLIIITADHGQLNTTNVALSDYPKLHDCLLREPSIEPRALNLFVKPGREAQFEQLFREAFGDKFELLTKEQVKQRRLFGDGRISPRFDELLGDYLAVAVSDLSIFNDRESAEQFVGVHAGLTEEEMTVPLIVVKKQRL